VEKVLRTFSTDGNLRFSRTLRVRHVVPDVQQAVPRGDKPRGVTPGFTVTGFTVTGFTVTGGTVTGGTVRRTSCCVRHARTLPASNPVLSSADS